jgi:3-hydroxyisobutyrate dehydrogenase
MTDTTQGAASPRVAVLGIGTMGAGMARNLLRAGLPVDVWNRTPALATALAREGAVAHESPSSAVAQADVVITMLPDAEAVQSVAFGQGVLAAMRPGAVWAQMGTIGVAAVGELAAQVKDERPDVYFVDAPVSGTRGPAEAGQLLILASGPGQARQVLEPVFEAIGRKTKWLGEVGAGTALKLVMNSWLVFLAEGTAEILALADSLGVDHDEVLDFLGAGNIASPWALTKFRKMETGDDSPDFSLQWALKDIRLALSAASDRPLPVLDAIGDRWDALVGEGLGGLDVSAARHGLKKGPLPDE